jgi:benzoyl-CoA reductase/2-hydroxyglutaryl-CoA dehydratase subunit BcrC/BadD/HgdB
MAGRSIPSHGATELSVAIAQYGIGAIERKKEAVMATASKALETLTEASKALTNPALLEWKKQGGKIVGFYYDYIPEELFTAAGILPYRMRATGCTGTELSDAYFSNINCTFVRDSFDLLLRGSMNFLDGLVVHNFCDHMRRIYDNCKATASITSQIPFQHFVVLPKKRGDEQVAHYRLELESLKKHLEEHFHVQITDEKLSDAIKIHNTTRRLQREIYELRKRDIPPITGAEMLAVMVGGTTMPRKYYNELLQQLVDDLKTAKVDTPKPKARLMVVGGGAVDDPRLIEVLESQGGMVVADALSFGSRAISADVVETGDPITALAHFELFDRTPTVRLCLTSAERNEFVLNMAREYRADGVISVATQYCDPWNFESLNTERYLEPKKVPHLALQCEYLLSGVGQMKTRVQAFMETLG